MKQVNTPKTSTSKHIETNWQGNKRQREKERDLYVDNLPHQKPRNSPFQITEIPLFYIKNSHIFRFFHMVDINHLFTKFLDVFISPPQSLTAKAPQKWWVGRRSGFLLETGNFSGEDSLLNFGRVSTFKIWFGWLL